MQISQSTHRGSTLSSKSAVSKNIKSAVVRAIQAREVLDSRGFPTVEVDLVLEANRSDSILGRAIVPSGASTGENEALELRDGDPDRFLGKGVTQAIKNIVGVIAPAVIGRDFSRQALFDDLLIELDGSKNKSKLGANALLGVSMAFARAHAALHDVPIYRSIATTLGSNGITLPVPLMNILNGGKHADNSLSIQEFMIVPAGFHSFSDALRAGTEVFHYLRKILNLKGVSTGVGDEGGFAPNFDSETPHEEALSAILQAIDDAGYKAGKEIYLALDAAASEFATEKDKAFEYQFEEKARSSEEMVGIYKKWCDSYPIISIEDGLGENDWNGWKKLSQDLGEECQLVGDDLFVTHPVFLKKGIDLKVANSILIKLNQIGTVTETLETMKLAQHARYSCIASHRSGETEDTFIADLAVGTDCGQIKTGSASRTDRIAKYNQLLRIEEELGASAKYAGKSAFRRLK